MKTAFILFFLLFALPLASAQTMSIGDYSTAIDSEVTVLINISDAESVAGGMVNISFDPSIVSVEHVGAGDFGDPVANINNISGWVKLVAARADNVNKNQAVLANIVFNGSSNGTSALTIEYASLNNESGALITPLTSNGKIAVSLSLVDTLPPSSIRDLVSNSGSSWINWTWTNPSDSDFNHTMVYLDGKFVDNTSDLYFNATNLIQGTLHTIGTRTVDLSGNVNETWVNDTAMTTGELPGGLSIKISKPTSYSFYPVGETVEFNAAVTDLNGNPVTSGISAYADISGPDSTSRCVILSEDAGNFVGEYTVKGEDARGIWTVNINAFNATSSGQASLKLFFIGAYFIQPYTDSRSYLLGETANFTAKVVKPVGSSQPLTDQNLSLNLSVYLFNTTTLVSGPVEMVFDNTTGKFHGDVNTGLLGSGLFSVVFSGNDTDGNIETESLTIGVSEDFNIIVGTDKTCYDRNEPVNIHGSMEFIDGSPLSSTDVNLWISLKGFMRSYTATTNETGGFNYTFQPFAAEAGNYTITSTAINLGLQRTAESHFTIHGLYLAPPSGTLKMVENSTQDIDFILYNLGETTLTGITAAVNDLDMSDNVDATIITTIPNELHPSENVYITLNVSAGTPVPENAAFFITVSTDQMSDETSELDVNLFSPNPVVVLEPDNIAVGLNQNQTALKTVTISNTGYGVLRNLTLTQPGYNWMRITSNTTVGDLKPGENTSFDIHIHSYNVSLGTYHDTVSITSDNHESMVVDLSASITDQTYGSLLFYVENELGQNISGASISLIDDTLYQEYTVITNSTGYALINDLPTGRYIYEVSSSSDNTLSQLNSVVVEPMEQPRRVNVTMQLSFIDFEWDVIPSTIDDWYQIVLNMTFETDAPVPIIVAFPPYLEYDMDPGDVRSGTLTVANLGIVSLFDVSITSNINSNVQFTPIVSHIEELKPKSSVQIPYTIELADDASSCNGFTGRININGKYIHFIGGEGVASYTGTTVPLIIKTPPCEQPDVGAGTIIGMVTDTSDGSPIDGARVVAGRYSTYTDGSGSYTLTNVRSGTYRITTYKDGYYLNSTTVRVTKDTTIPINLQLTPITTGGITGIVTDTSDGSPIDGARVAAGGHSDATDNSGSYTLSGVLTGTHTITASKRGYYTSSTTVMVTKDNAAVVNLQLTPIPEVPTGSISGMVTDDTGDPLSLALVVTNGGFDFTDISGSYTITGVPVGRNRVRASKMGYYSASKTVQVDDDRTTIVNLQLKKIIIPPIPFPDCECIDGTPPVIWVYKGPDLGWLTPPPTTPSKMFIENCNDEGTIEFSDAWGATISLNSLWLPSLEVNLGTIISSVLNILEGDIWHGEFIPKQIDPNEETMLDVENMGRFYSDMESFGITLPIPDIFGGALAFVYGPYPHEPNSDCLELIPLGGVEIKEAAINIVFPPWPDWPDWIWVDPYHPGPAWEPPVFTETIHEIVQLSISQNATMERDAFWAGLGIRNRMPDTNIDNVGVSLHISDENGSANDKFFIRAPRLEDISDIDGSGTISPLQLAKAQWLIIPKPGAGGVSGQTYNISADITYSVDGNNFRVKTEDVEILVNPQPQLILDYYLPSDVIGNKPFKLAVMATNDGYGTARNFSIETAQPVIYNPSGLMIDFEIIRSALQGEGRSDSLKINFGDLSPGESKLAWWEMVVSMDGTFTEFTGEYTHSSELGGMETSLIKELNANIIHREIETGAVNYSFLVTPKDDETYYLLLDSDSGGSTPVSIANYTVVSGPTPGNPNMDITIEDLTGQWVIVSIEDPYDNKVPILKVIRDSDGSEIPFYNYWMRDGRILIVDHYIEGFDGKYTVKFLLNPLDDRGLCIGQKYTTIHFESNMANAIWGCNKAFAVEFIDLIDLTGVPSIILKGTKITDSLCNIATRLDQGQYVGGVVKAITSSAKLIIDGGGVASHILNVVAPGSGIITETASDVIQLTIAAVQCLYDLLAAFSHEYLDITILSPANIHLYDSSGNHVGLNDSNMIELEIPNSIYYRDQQNHTHISIFEPENLNYTLITEATDLGNFSLIISHKMNGRIKTFEYRDVQQPTLQTTSIVDINNKSEYNLNVDLNGDDIIDVIKIPDLIKTNFVPNASIEYPLNGMVFSKGSIITLNGAGTDLEDGTLNDTSLHWVIDGCFSCSNLTGPSITLNTENMSVGNHSIVLKVFDDDGAIDADIIGITILFDNTPPTYITNLESKSSITWLNFTWTNPPDPDFNHTELYLNGTFITNIPAPQNYYNATGLLPDTSYELSTRTVDINGNINLTWVNDTASTLPASGTTLNLYTGWNLISLPLMPEDTSITSLLSSINGNYSIVWEYSASDTADHWKKYDPATPFGNDLTTMEPGKGYWIMMNSDDILNISGMMPEPTDIELWSGWNLIGYNSLNPQTITDALSSINGNYSIIWAYNASDSTDHWKKYDPNTPFGNDLANMEPGNGYWIMMTTDDIYVVVCED